METTPEPKPNSVSENKENPSLRILIADDFAAIRESLGNLLKARGYTVVSVHNGQALLDKLFDETQKFDLIITDNNMPEKSGLDALKEIRQNDKFNKLPVIFMTTDDYGGVLQDRVNKLGAVFMEKPFKAAKLFETIDKIFPKSEPEE